MIFLYALGFATLVGVVYMAISKKSSPRVRIAALGALALMVISVIVCLFVFFIGHQPSQQSVYPDVDPADLPPAQTSNPLTLVMFIFFLIALFVMVVVLSLRESKRTVEKDIEFGKDTGSW